jgi:hypothetical protein
MEYDERLRHLRLPTLAFRRCRGDMIETFKILHGIYDVKVSPTLPRRPGLHNTRGNSLSLFKRRGQKMVRKNNFTLRIVKSWNALPEHVVTAPSVNAFKNRLDKLWRSEPQLFDYRALKPGN